MKTNLWTQPDGSVATDTPTKAALAILQGEGGWFKLEDMEREIAKHLIIGPDKAVMKALTEEFQADWQAFLDARKGTPQEIVARRFVEAFTHGGLSEAEAFDVLDTKNRPAEYTSCRVIDVEDLPAERFERPVPAFRNAWKDDGVSVTIDMTKAHIIHMNRIRKARNVELEKESGSKFRQPPEIEALFTTERQTRLQALRDIPQTFDLTTDTPEELKAK